MAIVGVIELVERIKSAIEVGGEGGRIVIAERRVVKTEAVLIIV
jgi:hypothetical protein